MLENTSFRSGPNQMLPSLIALLAKWGCCGEDLDREFLHHPKLPSGNGREKQRLPKFGFGSQVSNGCSAAGYQYLNEKLLYSFFFGRKTVVPKPTYIA